MLQADFTAILGASSEQQFLDELIKFGTRLGFTKVAAEFRLRVPEPADFAWGIAVRGVNNLDSIYLGRHFNDQIAIRQDPVNNHMAARSTPIIWSQTDYVKCGAGQLWEEQASFGLSAGVAVGLHLPGRLDFVIGFDRDQPLDPAAFESTVNDLHLFAVYAQEAGTPIFTNNLFVRGSRSQKHPLSKRELEVLRWTLEGKTAWDVAGILSISERTAAQHAQSATRKLDCVNKHQAAVKALRLALIN